jgi:regulatory protein
MKQEKFVDDERFATSFVRSKLRSNSWGKSKIKYALKQKRIDPSFIEQAFEDVDEDFYQEKITLLAQKKFDKLKGDLSLYEKRQKTAVYLQSKGYESSLIFPIINNLGSDE